MFNEERKKPVTLRLISKYNKIDESLLVFYEDTLNHLLKNINFTIQSNEYRKSIPHQTKNNIQVNINDSFNNHLNVYSHINNSSNNTRIIEKDFLFIKTSKDIIKLYLQEDLILLINYSTFFLADLLYDILFKSV